MDRISALWINLFYVSANMGLFGFKINVPVCSKHILYNLKLNGL